MQTIRINTRRIIARCQCTSIIIDKVLVYTVFMCFHHNYGKSHFMWQSVSLFLSMLLDCFVFCFSRWLKRSVTSQFLMPLGLHFISQRKVVGLTEIIYCSVLPVLFHFPPGVSELGGHPKEEKIRRQLLFCPTWWLGQAGILLFPMMTRLMEPYTGFKMSQVSQLCCNVFSMWRHLTGFWILCM